MYGGGKKTQMEYYTLIKKISNMSALYEVIRNSV